MIRPEPWGTLTDPITDPQKDRRAGKGVRVCANESRPAAGADLTSSLTIRPTGERPPAPVAHAGTGGTPPRHCGKTTCRAPHDVTNTTDGPGWRCPGPGPRPHADPGLAYLLARRPDLVDLTATTHARALEVSCA